MTKNDTILILGGDGYLGWSLGLAFANRTNAKVVLADNLIKREWEKEVNAKLLVPFHSPRKRITEYEKIFGKKNISFEKVELLDQDACVKLLKKHNPSVIINAAQQPSAPFSMMNAKNAAATFSNNIVGHLNVLWAIAAVNKNINYIKLGSAGCYMDVDTDFLPLGKKDFTFEHEGQARKILNAWFPMQATDFYHQSKISDFLINDLCASVWKLKILTVQQSTIFGATIDENRAVENHSLSTRFNYDSVFSTVLNRFVCQLAIGHPLTVYGDGSQTTGLISLTDTVDHFLDFANTDMTPGTHDVAHNYTQRLSIKEMAETLTNLAGATEVQYIENPRKENNGSLKKEVEVHPVVAQSHTKKDRRLQTELANLLEFTKRYKDNIDRSIIMPTIKWEQAPTTTTKTAAQNAEEPKKKVFFNYGTVGPMGAHVYKAAANFLEEYFRVGPPDILLKYEPYIEKLAAEAATLVHCDPSEITYIKNTTEGLNIASEALPLRKGDEVLLGAKEYPANIFVWQKKQKEGITVRLIDGANGKETFDALIANITPKTKVISISWAQHYDGYLPDLAKLSRICRSKGIFLVVDGVQGIGVRAIDLQKTPVDFLLCGGQKYMGGMVGMGFMYVNKNLMPLLKETQVGMRSMAHFDTESYTLKDTASRFEGGTVNLMGVVTLHAALKHINQIGIRTVEKKNKAFLAACKKRLTEENISFIDHDEDQGNIIALRVSDPAALAAYLKKQQIYIKPVKDIARISFSHNSSIADFDRLLTHVKAWVAKHPMESMCSKETSPTLVSAEGLAPSTLGL